MKEVRDEIHTSSAFGSIVSTSVRALGKKPKKIQEEGDEQTQVIQTQYEVGCCIYQYDLLSSSHCYNISRNPLLLFVTAAVVQKNCYQTIGLKYIMMPLLRKRNLV